MAEINVFFSSLSARPYLIIPIFPQGEMSELSFHILDKDKCPVFCALAQGPFPGLLAY